MLRCERIYARVKYACEQATHLVGGWCLAARLDGRHTGLIIGLGYLSGNTGRKRRLVPALSIGLVMLILASSGCSTTTAGPESSPARVTAPDSISTLPSDELERRLGGLLGPGRSDGPSHGAPVTEPTPTPVDPLEEILNALESKALGELLITVSESLFEDLNDPRLVIKSPPAKGRALKLSSSEILFVPDDGATGSDKFEYELRDGDRAVFSAVVELRPVSGASINRGQTP